MRSDQPLLTIIGLGTDNNKYTALMSEKLKEESYAPNLERKSRATTEQC